MCHEGNKPGEGLAWSLKSARHAPLYALSLKSPAWESCKGACRWQSNAACNVSCGCKARRGQWSPGHGPWRMERFMFLFFLMVRHYCQGTWELSGRKKCQAWWPQVSRRKLAGDPSDILSHCDPHRAGLLSWRREVRLLREAGAPVPLMWRWDVSRFRGALCLKPLLCPQSWQQDRTCLMWLMF